MNIVSLVGRLTKDPELRYTPSGKAVVRTTIAVDKKMSKENKQEAEAKNQPTADFISLVFWNKLAELVANYLSKGSRIGVIGRLQTGSYEKDGHRIYTTDVIVNELDFLESSKNGQAPINKQNDNGDLDGFFPIDNDDIPF